MNHTLHVLRTLRFLTLIAMIATFAACGDDGPGQGLGPGLDDLTEVEANNLLGALLSAYALTPNTPSLNGGGGGGAFVPTTSIIVDTTQTTANCPVSGSVTVLSQDSVQIVQDQQTNPTPGTLAIIAAQFGGTFDITSTYQNCGSQDSQGTVWTIDASPGLNLAFTFTGDLDSVVLSSGTSTTTSNWTWNGQWTGTFNWASGSRTGTCPLSVQWDVTASTAASGLTTSTTQQTGTLCGINVTRTS